MSTTPSPIYSLLPAVIRNRDAVLGGPLQALFGVMESQYALVQDNLAQLYDDQFIETCAPWVIPYIGQLIGYDTVYTAALTSPDSRAEVANTMGYRRRKGTLIALEQITRDVSGRSTVAVEEFRNLVTTSSLRDVRPLQFATASLRTGADLESLQGPFTALNRTIDVRNITPRRVVPPVPDTTPLDVALHGGGRFNVPQVSVWMWRLQSVAVGGAPAFAFGNGAYAFSALGGPIPLFQTALQQSAPFSALMQEADVPEPISLARFAADPSAFYPASIELIADGTPVPLAQITCANLADSLDGSVCTVPAGMIAIDPQIGRIQYASDVESPMSLLVNYNYGAAAPMAGGGYDRTAKLAQPGTQAGLSFVNGSSPFFAIVGTAQYPTLQSAVSAWNSLPQNSAGTILLSGFAAHEVDLTGADAIQIPAESQLLIASAAAGAAGVAPEWKNSCVTLRGNIEIVAPAPSIDGAGGSLQAGQLQFSGLWISGQVILSGGEACAQFTDCTLVPGVSLTPKGSAAEPDEPSILGSAETITLALNRVVTGPIALPPTCSMRICSSIVDAGSAYCAAIAGTDLAGPGATLHIEDSTVIGRVWVQAMRLASNTIFWAQQGCLDPWAAPVMSKRLQIGCVRFCWLPADSITPKRYLCLPAAAAVEPALQPTFVSLKFGDPGYCLLSGDVPMAIWKGADNGSQMGVFYQIQETEAVTNIQIRSGEYLPASLRFGVFLIPSSTAIQAIAPMGYGQPVRRCGCAGVQELPFGIGIGLI